MLVFSNITLRRGVNVLLANANSAITPGQKVGLVGKNGSGKSTILSLLKEEMSADVGCVSIPTRWRIASVNQDTPALDISALDHVIDGDITYRQLAGDLTIANADNDGNRIAAIHAELDAIDAWTIQARAAALLHGLGFVYQQLTLPVSVFSGGWRMRLNLAQALLCPSDLLLLDEPTNHLDLDAIIWLERWLKSYSGTLILISHDRDFLDPIVNKIIHISQQSLFEYSGNYSDFETQRAIKLSQQQSLFRHQQQKVMHIRSYIDRFKAKASKAKQAQSRIKMLERMEKVLPAHIDNPFHFSFKAPDKLPSPLFTMKDITAGYGNTLILEKIELNLVPGSRIGLLGQNGAGKSTLIKLLAGELQPKSGTMNLAKGVKLGYFAQHQLETLCEAESALWHLSQLAQISSEQQLRNYLGGFGFSGDKVMQSVASFSGGEKARLVLALIVWKKPNLLLLDEPSNHLDLDMRQALTRALIDFEGALVVVSHDRYLLRSVADEFYLVHDKQVRPFDGDLANYQKWFNDNKKAVNLSEKVVDHNVTKPRITEQHKTQNNRDVGRGSQIQTLKKQLQHCEKKIEKINNMLSRLEIKLLDNVIYQPENKVQLMELLEQQTELKNQLKDLEFNWCSTQQQLDDLGG